jgi:hypothetical protein
VVRKGRQHQWGGEAEQAGGKGRRRRWGGEAEQARRRDSGAVRGSHQIRPQKNELFLRRAAAAASAGEMRPRQWRSTGRCGGADRGPILVGGSAGACGMAPAPEIQTTEKSARRQSADWEGMRREGAASVAMEGEGGEGERGAGEGSSGDLFLPIYRTGMRLRVGLELVCSYFTAIIEGRPG